MALHFGGLPASPYYLLSITLLLVQSVLADTESTILCNSESASRSNIAPGIKPLQISLDEEIKIEDNSTFTTEVSEPQKKLQELLNHREESHIHLGGEIKLKDDATISHPSMHDVDAFEVDISIDFE